MVWLIIGIVLLLAFLGAGFFVVRARQRNRLPAPDWHNAVIPPPQQVSNAPFTQNVPTFPTARPLPAANPPVLPLAPGNPPAPPLAPGNAPVPTITIKEWRPGTISASMGVAIPTNLIDPIRRPDTVPVHNSQKECIVCGHSIDWSSRADGWARCLSTKKLVHGYCYAFVKDERIENYCAVCEGSCRSRQAMRIEGTPV